ncbi:MAG: alpha/beta hydrolase [Bacteroides sp.]|nr:alpha/beta hydrolase [Eubacterium sp.]MCM1419006.1 alpha/beta hydrolase [Roseburia sp.]MCM1462872.1 alpha/beta hydrolase [Bacteroides sp.]
MVIEIGGIAVHYRKEGSGENVLLLHGWGSSAAPFAAIIETLKARYTVYAPDLPGFGETAEPPDPWDVGDYADFIVRFCEKTGIKKTILLAHSFGGRIVLKLLAREDCPIECDKVVLTGCAGIKPVPTARARLRARVYRIGKGFLSLKPMKALFPRALERLRDRHGSADYRAASPLMRQVLVKTVNEDLSPLLPKIRAEILLIWGANDDATPLSDGKRMEKEMPNAALVTLENAGHYAFLDQQYTFLRVISSYLGVG